MDNQKNQLDDIVNIIENAPMLNETAQQISFHILKKRLSAFSAAGGKVGEAAAMLQECRSIEEMKEQLPHLQNVMQDITNDRKEERQRLFVDMDGTLAVFQNVDHLEQLLEEGYFLNLKPQENVIDAIQVIINQHPEVDVYIMSSVLSDSRYAVDEKNAWLDRYLPEIPMDHRIFPPCGENKLDYVPEGIRPSDHLLDDYTKNLVLWEPPAKGIKLLNGINHTHGTWKGSMMHYDTRPEELADNILAAMKGKTKELRHIRTDRISPKEPKV